MELRQAQQKARNAEIAFMRADVLLRRPTQTVDPNLLILLKAQVDIVRQNAEIVQMKYEIGARGGDAISYENSRFALAEAEVKYYDAAGDRDAMLEALARKKETAEELVGATRNGYDAGICDINALNAAQFKLQETLYEIKKIEEGNTPKTGVSENPLAANATAAARDKFLYDNRTFWDWKAQSETELNPARHIEIVNAFGAFARKGFGKEATEAILKLLEDYPGIYIPSRATANNDPLSSVVVDVFIRCVSPDDSLPILLERYRATDEEKRGTMFDLICLIVTYRDIEKVDKQILQQVVSILLGKMQNESKWFGNETLFLPGMETDKLGEAFKRLSGTFNEIPETLEKVAFSKGELGIRRFAFHTLVHGQYADFYNQEQFPKYLPRLIDTLLSDDKAEQEFAGKTIRFYAFGSDIRSWPIAPGYESTLHVSQYDSIWCEPGQTFYANEGSLRMMVQAVMFVDEDGVQTAKLLKKAYAQAPDNLRKALIGNFYQIERLSPNRQLQAIDSRSLVKIYFHEGKYSERGEKIRQNLANTSEILKIFDDAAVDAAIK